MSRLQKIISLARHYLSLEAQRDTIQLEMAAVEDTLEEAIGGTKQLPGRPALRALPAMSNPGPRERKGWGPAIERFLKQAGAAGAKTPAVAEGIGAGTDRVSVSRIGVALQREFKKGTVKRIGRGLWALGEGAGAKPEKARAPKTCKDPGCQEPRWTKWPRCAEHQKAKWKEDRERNKKPAAKKKATNEHAEALEWARKNPDNPKAAQILAIAEQRV
jgi:hypothetical protein